MNYHARFEHAGESTYDALIAGNAHLLVGRKVTVAAGEALPRGAVIGRNAATGEYSLGRTGGPNQPDHVLAEAVDGLAPTIALAYSRGDFNLNAVTIRAGEDVAAVIEKLRAVGIVLLPAMP